VLKPKHKSDRLETVALELHYEWLEADKQYAAALAPA
jgi:hypothetical protein